MSSFLFTLSPRDTFLIIQGLGGSSALLYGFFTGTSFEKRLALHFWFLTSLYGCLFLGLDKVFPIEGWVLITISCVLLREPLPFLGILLMRSIFLEGGVALTMQLAFLYLLDKRYCMILTGFLNGFLILCLPPEIGVKYLLFPLSGALGIFFLYLARGPKEHLKAFVVYFLNILFFCFLFENAQAALDVLRLTLGVIPLIILSISLKLIAHNRAITQFPIEFTNFVLKAKNVLFVFLFLGMIFSLGGLYLHAEWMILAQLSFVFQVGILEIYRKLGLGSEKMGKRSCHDIKEK